MVHSTEIAWPHNENGFLFMTLFKSLQWAAVVQNVVAKASFTNACWGDTELDYNYYYVT